ncbi:MAG TPA: RidA family protein [Polyangiales bacterium]|nr:RidA family protein [Polyangiales bacterium]
MSHKLHDLGVSKHIGRYSDAIEVAAGLRWLYTSGTPGISDTGAVPDGIDAQARLAWQHIVAALAKANMTVRDLVKVTTYLTNAADIPAYAKVRSEFLEGVQPAFMLAIIPELVKPNMLVEVEIIAAAH